MTETRFDVLAIGNAIVDVMAPCEDSLVERTRDAQGRDDAGRRRGSGEAL